jgi:hypothetical protein
MNGASGPRAAGASPANLRTAIPIASHDPIACLCYAVDAVRESLDLVLAILPAGASDRLPPARTWHLEAAVRRVAHASRVVRGLADELADERISSLAERLDAERRAVVGRVQELLGRGPGSDLVVSTGIDEPAYPAWGSDGEP